MGEDRRDGFRYQHSDCAIWVTPISGLASIALAASTFCRVSSTTGESNIFHNRPYRTFWCRRPIKMSLLCQFKYHVRKTFLSYKVPHSQLAITIHYSQCPGSYRLRSHNARGFSRADCPQGNPALFVQELYNNLGSPPFCQLPPKGDPLIPPSPLGSNC